MISKAKESQWLKKLFWRPKICERMRPKNLRNGMASGSCLCFRSKSRIPPNSIHQGIPGKSHYPRRENRTFQTAMLSKTKAEEIGARVFSGEKKTGDTMQRLSESIRNPNSPIIPRSLTHSL
uniref:Uncharacterized protein n=1 Tax=Glycine max TaxID=3847 RepID=C6TIL5_SOYBN|nr:unknown [Glycine max]